MIIALVNIQKITLHYETDYIQNHCISPEMMIASIKPIMIDGIKRIYPRQRNTVPAFLCSVLCINTVPIIIGKTPTIKTADAAAAKIIRIPINAISVLPLYPTVILWLFFITNISYSNEKVHRHIVILIYADSEAHAVYSKTFRRAAGLKRQTIKPLYIVFQTQETGNKI